MAAALEVEIDESKVYLDELCPGMRPARPASRVGIQVADGCRG
jgi:hypothetical protein